MFNARPSNSRLVLAYMSKQKKVHKWLSATQVELAKTCYLMMLRNAVAIKQNNERKSNNKSKDSDKKRTSPRLAKKRRLIHDSSDGSSDCDMEEGLQFSNATRSDADDEVTNERESWKHMPRETFKKYEESDSLLNEFQMMWELREQFSLHFIVFKQCAVHLAHEGNVESIFSSAGRLADPNMDPRTLQLLVRIHFNMKSYMPPVKDIRERYYRKCRKSGDLYDKNKVDEDDPGADAPLLDEDE